MAIKTNVQLVGLLLFLCIVRCWSGIIAQASRMPELRHYNPVHIGAEGHVVQGRISANAKNGDLVSYNVVVEGHEDPDLRLHLRVEVRYSNYKRRYLYQPNITVSENASGNSQVEHPVEHFVNNSLPFGMGFAVVNSDMFYVNNDRYIAVRDLSNIGDQTRIHFDVILRDNLADIQYVSNHLPFVVDVEFTKLEQNPDALLFAGVLVFAIVAISLVIPFTVRAKRRCRTGKPIFGCGSPEDLSEQSSFESMPDDARNRANSVGGKDNLAMILENGHLAMRRASVDSHTSIQKRNLMSTSSIKFQPRWMDPHYSDTYNRPYLCKVKRKHSLQKAGKRVRISAIARLANRRSRRQSSRNENKEFEFNSDKFNGDIINNNKINGDKINTNFNNQEHALDTSVARSYSTGRLSSGI